jgi:nucleoside-diphosphate-sugar epimerase
MKILVTGTEGYIGARLAPILMAAGHEVVGFDTGFYREGSLYQDPRRMPLVPLTRIRDLRHATADDFAGIEAVVHLAELSNDPLGQNRPEVTYKINHEGSVQLAKLARTAGARRFVYASSCSVYGLGGGSDFLSEESPTNPQTAYAVCKTLVERDLRPMGSKDFCVTFLRNATAFGPSPRMRFDIVINDLCALAWTKKHIAMTSDGSPWRPVVHIEDICAAIHCALEAPAEAVNTEIFNVGRNSENYRVRELAQQVAAVFAGCQVSSGPPAADNRSYRVSFDKITSRLPGFVCRWSARQGIEELHDLFQRIDFTQEMYEFRAFTRLKELKYLSRTGQIDEEFFWR